MAHFKHDEISHAIEKADKRFNKPFDTQYDSVKKALEDLSESDRTYMKNLLQETLIELFAGKKH